MSDYPASDKLRVRALGVIPGGANTMSKRAENFALGAMPAFLDKGLGSHVWDVDGNEFIDYIGALGPVTLGYCYPAVDAAITRQLSKGIIHSFPSPLEVEVCEALYRALPGADWVRLMKSGAEVTAAAVRVARAATGRNLILNSGYHGWHDVWTAERSAPADRGVPASAKELIAGFDFVAPMGKSSIDAERTLAALLEKHRGKVAAIMLEPISYYNVDTGAALAEVRRLADEYGVLLIFDEIVSGFRIARGGAAEKFGVTPDMATWAKGMANGMPLAALTGRADLAPLVSQLVISSTYSGETLSLAAAQACLQVYENEDVIDHCTALGQKLGAGLQQLASAAGLQMITGGHPMMSGYLFIYDDPNLNCDLTTLFLQEMAVRGILIRRNGLLFISYSHTEVDINQTLDAASESFAVIKQAADAGDASKFLRTRQAKQAAPQVRR